ncbi:MAG: hypothetical protein ACFE0Q_15225 [Anaerolineae bacterium]
MTQRQPSLKSDHLCVRCGSQRIQSGAMIAGKEGWRGSNRLPIDRTTIIELDNFVCLDCGYTESYIGDRGMLNRIERQWQKVAPAHSKANNRPSSEDT